ncbi:MAG TPA: elongation factor P maturation arginine rhamnosyltransferase EarP [Burkholderiaceae bacterium]
MSSDTQQSLALFCKVVDNFGDVGICWRLARQLQREHGIAVTLWVDDLPTLHRICPSAAVDAELQQIDGVAVRHWRKQEYAFAAADIADLVIEFFGCEIPEGYVAAMAQCEPRPVWLNLEGLSAEAWVEGCHTLPSPHPRLPLTKHFFFPGFTASTGGLLHEAALEGQRSAFQADASNETAFLAGLGLMPIEMAGLKVSLFCYPHAPVGALFEAWQRGATAITCLVPEGVASDAVRAWVGTEAGPGAARTEGALTVRVIPFLPQPDYDRLLWVCDFNFVRGEDSFVRAQWAGKPFIWHIYPQDENLHHVKLRAFLQRYLAADPFGPPNRLESLEAASLCWNAAQGMASAAAGDWFELWPKLQADLPEIAEHAAKWRAQVLKNGDLASNLVQFVKSRQSVSGENKV